METRILLPAQLEIQFAKPENIIPKDKKKRSRIKSAKEKPTSSSGCADSEISDSDSDFEIFPSNKQEHGNSTDSEEEEDEEDREEEKSGIWNPSYNLRKKGKTRKGDIEDIVVANADSNVQSEGLSGGNTGHFSRLRIVARRTIEKGTVLRGNEGEVCVVFLKDVPPIKKDDIRFIFGCFDRLIKDDKDNDNESRSEGEEDSSKQIHLCNWIRFVKEAKGLENKGRGNVRATFAEHQAIFQFTQSVPEGEEIFVDFEATPREERLGHRATLQQYAPLDLSKTLTPEAGKAAPISIFPFSINNVLQPGKIFQPFGSGKERSTIGGMSAGQARSILSQPRGAAQGLQSLTPGVPGGLRPILRTRGRERSLLPCEVCGKAFDRPSLLKRHMRTHTGEKPHICDVCSKGFSTSSSLNTHRRIHSGEKPHQCPICGKRFTASSNLYYHRMTHNKEKPHKCLLCGKSFPTPGDLKSHQYVHSGSWPYNCPVCHRGFSKQTNLRNHLLLHSGDKPHNCQICGKKFALACNLRAHLRTHEEEPVSSCLTCKSTFLNSLNMLENGQCRACIIQAQSSSGAKAPALFPLQLPPPPIASASESKTENLALSALSKFVTTPGITFAPVEGALSNFNLPPSPGYFSPENLSLLRSPNPFLEQFLQWNWRFAKETAGNLGLMQQKLLESQMLAAQLMGVSSNSSIGSGDILKFRL